MRKYPIFVGILLTACSPGAAITGKEQNLEVQDTAVSDTDTDDTDTGDTDTDDTDTDDTDTDDTDTDTTDTDTTDTDETDTTDTDETDTDDTDTNSWPFSGAYNGSIEMSGDYWGVWCTGTMDVTVEPDGVLDGEGSCDYDLTSYGYGTGTVWFYPTGELNMDGELEDGELYVDTDVWGSFEGTTSGSHSINDTELVMEFLWTFQYNTVTFERD